MKRKHRLKIKISDEARLVDRGDFSISWIKILFCGLLIAGVFVVIGIGIVWFTPLKKKLPGYMPPAQRALTEEAYLRVDSLQRLINVQRMYLDNIVKSLDTERIPDLPDTLGKALPFEPDSIMVASEAEKEFMKKMEEAGYVITLNEDYEDTAR